MGTRRILIADDSPIETDRIKKSLESLRGAEVVSVEDGAAAVTECKRTHYDLVLCDFEMPGLNGLQVVRVLRSSWSRLELPILMLTVHDDVQTKVLSLRQGANDYVTKPVEPEELLARVQAQLDLKSAVEANIGARARMLEGRKLATIGRLTAGLAHDLNTPAQFIADNLVFLQKAVASSSQLLERTRKYFVGRTEGNAPFADEFHDFWRQKRVGYLVDEAPKALEEALNGVMRMARTVRDLKEFAGPPESQWGPADINRALENTVTVSRQVWSSVAEVSLELDRSLPQLACDITALKQAFFDILMAAVERAPIRPGARAAVVRTAALRDAPSAGARLHITIRSRPVEGAIEIQFRDDGPAFCAELQRALRHSGSPSDLLELMDDQGLGMAYSVVAIQHQGKLSDESLPGQGATLVVRLREGLLSPRARELQAAAPPPASKRA
jgi:DNA-binding response OmpR family regulator